MRKKKTLKLKEKTLYKKYENFNILNLIKIKFKKKQNIKTKYII